MLTDSNVISDEEKEVREAKYKVAKKLTKKAIVIPRTVP